MKLINAKINHQGKKLIIDDIEFDPSLLKVASIDKDEKVIILNYDYAECGNPLNLPFDALNFCFIVKFTPHNIHIAAVAELGDNCDAFCEMTNEFGSLELNVRISGSEKQSLLHHILYALLSQEAELNALFDKT